MISSNIVASVLGFLVLLSSAVGCGGEASVRGAASSPGGRSEPHAGSEPPLPEYKQPDFWVVDEYGIGQRFTSVSKGKAVAILYSTWCNRAEQTLQKQLDRLKTEHPGYEFIGLFADAEADQLLGQAKKRGFTQREIDELEEMAELTDVLDEEALLDGRFGIRKFRVPRDQWERLGGEPGGLDLICFHDARLISCPETVRFRIGGLAEALRQLQELERQQKELEQPKE